MHDQLQEEAGAIEDFSLSEGAKAGGQPCFHLDCGKKPLQDHQAGEGREILVFKSDFRQRMGFSSDVGSAKFHGVNLLVLEQCDD
jgi:hypothetical protein